jgi:hypothetical protein
MGNKSDAHHAADLVYGRSAPAYSHIQILPDNSIKTENLKGVLDIRSRYSYGSSAHYGMSMWEAFHGGESVLEKQTETGSIKKTTSQSIGGEELENSFDYFRCIFCARDLDDSVYRGACHEVGANYLCGPCYLSWDGSAIDANNSSVVEEDVKLLESVRDIARSIKPNTADCAADRDEYIAQMRTLFPIELRVGIGESIEYWPIIVEAIEIERRPPLDYDLDHYEMQSLFSFEAMHINDKIEYWENMTVAKIKMMDKGEYMVYYNVISDALNVC